MRNLRSSNPSLRQLNLASTVAFLGLALAGCGSMPGSVSSLSDVKAASRQGSINLVSLTAPSLPPTVERGDSGFPSSFASSADTAYGKLGPGDRLQVRVWEGGTPAVFTAGPDLGELTVDETGRLYLPYVGAIQAAGQTIPQVRATVIRRL